MAVEKGTEVLNKLLQINKDNANYYQRMSKRTVDSNLKTLFNHIASDNEKNALALEREITPEYHVQPTFHKETKVHFMDKMKEMFAGNDRKVILSSCEAAEKVQQQAYQEAISSNELSMKTRQLIRNQQMSSKSLYDSMLTLRMVLSVFITSMYF